MDIGFDPDQLLGVSPHRRGRKASLYCAHEVGGILA